MTAVATASPIPITAGTDWATLSDARTWLTTAPTDSSASPTAAAMPSGGHHSPTRTPTTPASSSAPMSRHGVGLIPRWSRTAKDCRTPSSLIELEKANRAARQAVTITVAMGIS